MPRAHSQPSDFERKLCAELASRLAALRPAVREYEELAAALEVLDRTRMSSSTPAAAEPRRARRAKAHRAAGGKAAPASRATESAEVHSLPPIPDPRQSAPERHPTPALANAALALITAEPGLRIPDLAARLGCLQNPLFAILRDYEREGRVVKQGRGWHPGAAPAPTAREIILRAQRPSAEAA
jgi:hypothetical protein